MATAKVIGGVLLVLPVALVAFIWFAGAEARKSLRETGYAITTEPELVCSPGTEQRISRWGKLGWARACVRVDGWKDGPWDAWEYGRRVLTGGYRNDVKHGPWVWLDEDGEARLEIEYSGGKELGD